MGPGFCPEFGCRALPAQCVWQGSGFAADQTNAMLATSNGGDKSSRNRESLRLLGITEEFSICGREIKCFFCWLLRNFSPFTQRFFAFPCGGYHLPSGCCGCVGTTPRGVVSAEKTAFSERMLCADGCVLFPPAHSAFLAFLYGGGITTLGVRFMPLKRWTPAGHGGVFAVFMLPRNSPHVGRISPRRVHTPPQPLTAHTAAHRGKHGAFSLPETSTGSIGSTA